MALKITNIIYLSALFNRARNNVSNNAGRHNSKHLFVRTELFRVVNFDFSLTHSPLNRP